ncbi:MAG: creatininase family protein [Oscillospiraceae bacterium]|nr:creatininase family protein [Oscillospiraceae bacterium]MBQ3224801.1 creatininase family protein [Oscillospiraceae bacterium]MBQ7054662.1 creatininase family protein [Oscillospiraceae bacterium]
MLWKDIFPDEFEAAVKKCGGVCVIPIGAMEVHGVHMALGVDTLQAAEFSKRAAEVSEVCVFPELYFGDLGGANLLPGSIIFPIEVIWTILEHACCEIIRNGFKKIVIVSGHGGNQWMLTAFLRNMLIKHPEMLIYKYFQGLIYPAELLSDITKYPYLTENDVSILESYEREGKQGGHGCFSEVGLSYDIDPTLVRIDKVDAVSASSTRMYDKFDVNGIETWLSWFGNFPNSYVADIHYGMNKRIARAMGQRMTEKLSGVLKLIKEDTVSADFHREWYEKSFGTDLVKG